MANEILLLFHQDLNIMLNEVSETQKDGHSRPMGMVMVPARLVVKVECQDSFSQVDDIEFS